MTKSKPVERTHKVTGNILHNNKFYTFGDTIIFGEEISEEHILELLALGMLEGPIATEKTFERAFNERETTMAGMTPDQQRNMWKSFIALTEESRKYQELAEARMKDTDKGNRDQRIDESIAAQKHIGAS